MTDDEPDAGPLPAGHFSSWLIEAETAIRGKGEAEVPCAGCTACCRSFQFIHIDPDERETLARIPPELLFPAPRSSGGQLVLGYDEHGRCPMLVDDRCSIYEDRPRTCRAYDCRIFAATGVEVDDDKFLIARRVRRWQFALPTEEDLTRREAVRDAAAYVAHHKDLLSASGLPANPSEVAATAIAIHRTFLPGAAESTQLQPARAESDPDAGPEQLCRVPAGGGLSRTQNTPPDEAPRVWPPRTGPRRSGPLYEEDLPA
jgi:Fe-S-cluster containining protein